MLHVLWLVEAMPVRAMVRVIVIVGIFAGIGIGLVAAAWHRGWFWLGVVLWWGGGLIALDSFWPKVSLFGRTLGRAPRQRQEDPPVVALTFDDGPSIPATGQILDILARYSVPATFFVLGENCERHPDDLLRIVSCGHALGNHTYSHRRLTWKTRRQIIAEVTRWEHCVGSILARADLTLATLPHNRGESLFRAPHGFKNPWLPAVLQARGYHLIGWTRGIWDADLFVDADLLFKRVTRRVRPGEIVLLHDGRDTASHPDRSATVTLLPRLIEFYRREGYRFATIPELGGLR